MPEGAPIINKNEGKSDQVRGMGRIFLVIVRLVMVALAVANTELEIFRLKERGFSDVVFVDKRIRNYVPLLINFLAAVSLA